MPSGHTVTYPDAFGYTTVTFNTTADTPDEGTPPLPRTFRCTTPPEGTGPAPPRLDRVSSNRAGANDVNAPATDGADTTDGATA